MRCHTKCLLKLILIGSILLYQFGLCFDNDSIQHNTQPDRKYAYLYETLKIYFLRWYLPLVVCLGALGTVFCLVFLFLSRLFPPNMLIWLVSICIGDCFILFLEGIWMILKVWDAQDLRDINDMVCVIHTALSNYMFYWSAYMQTMLSLQRALLIIRPIRASHNGPNMKILFIIWSVTTVVLIFPMMPYPMYWRVINNDCDPIDNSLFTVTTLCDFIIWGLIPLLGMTSATAVICWNIFRVRRTFKQNEVNANNLTCDVSIKSATPERIQTRQSCHVDSKRRSIQSYMFQILAQHTLNNKLPRQRNFRYSTGMVNSPTPTRIGRLSSVTWGGQNIGASQRHGPTDNAGHVTRLLISMNIWYMISTYPLMIYLMVLNFYVDAKENDVHRFMYYLCRSLCFLNACCNWIFYCATGRLFRQRIRQIMLRLWRRLRFRSFNSDPIECSNNLKINHSLPVMCAPNDYGDNIKFHFDAEPKFKNDFNDKWEKYNLEKQNRCLQIFKRLPLFKCKCLCTTSIDTDSLYYQNVMSHSGIERRLIPNSHKQVCCTGFCCWKFWWYGLKSGRLKDEPNNPLQAITAALNLSSSSYGNTGEINEKIPRTDVANPNILLAQSPSVGLGQSRQITEEETSEWQAECIRSCQAVSQTEPMERPIKYASQILTVPNPSSSNCYCYISSLGNRQYHHHLCGLHNNSQTKEQLRYRSTQHLSH